MNPDRKLFGEAYINGTRVDLGKTSLDNLLLRAREQYVRHIAANGRCDMRIRFSEKPIVEDDERSQLVRLENEFMSRIEAPSSVDEMYPGWTYADILRVTESSAYADYNFYAANPTKRIGADKEIKTARDVFESAFPGLLAYFPPWVET